MTPLFQMRYQRHGHHAEVVIQPVVAMPQQTRDVTLPMPAATGSSRRHAFSSPRPWRPASIRLDASLFDRPLPTANETALKRVEAQCQRLLR